MEEGKNTICVKNVNKFFYQNPVYKNIVNMTET